MKAISEPHIAAAAAASVRFAADRDQLCVLTCGSVDDGKSTLIGRLLLDASLVFDDHVAALTRDSKRTAPWRAISIPPCWSTGSKPSASRASPSTSPTAISARPRRRFIVADTPGHKDYTRNMVTGASTSDLAILLVDAEKGLLEQTRRHAFICSLLGIRQFVLAVNKMDLVGFDERRFRDIAEAFAQFAGRFSGCQRRRHSDFGPARRQCRSRQRADAVVSGLPLLEYLETVAVDEPPDARGAAAAGAICQSAECEFPRLCRNHRVRRAAQRHGHRHPAHRSAIAHRADRDDGRRA